jgi:RNA polymerase sigma factor (sigma-70 family)
MVTEKQYNSAVEEYTRNLYRYLKKTLRDQDAAKDLTQDCFLKLWSNRHQVDSTKIKSWLFAVAHNSMLNYLKSEGKKSRIGEYDHEHLPYVFQKDIETKEIIDRGLMRLAPLHKSIILLRDLEGYSYKEIGEILHLNESKVKDCLFQARQKLKSSIQHLMTIL